MSDWMKVAAVAEFVAGEPRYADIDGGTIAVFRLDDGFYAIEDLCSHDGQPLGTCARGAEIICPRHGARFCIKTGEALSAPAYEAIAVFPLKIEDGIVYTRDHRWD